MTTTHEPEDLTPLRFGQFLGPRVAGYNTDRIDVTAGLREASLILGDLTPIQEMILSLGLNEWRRGEEERAQRTLSEALDLTGVYRVVAAARAAGEAAAQPATP